MRFLRRILSMCDLSWEILMRTLLLSCVLLFCAFMLLAHAGRLSAENYTTYLLAEELFRLPQSLLLIAVLGGAVVEDFICQ